MGVFKVSKYLLFLNLNIIIAFTSIILLAFGTILQIEEDKGITNFSPLYIGSFSIGVGILDVIMSTWGFYIFARKKSEILNYYAIILLIVFGLQVVLGAIALGSVHKDDVDKALHQLFYRFDLEALQIIQKIQKNFRCCGFTGPDWWTHHNKDYPASCCADESQPCKDPYHRGCADIYSDIIEKNLSVIGGIALGFAPVELASVVLAWYLRLSTKNKE